MEMPDGSFVILVTCTIGGLARMTRPGRSLFNLPIAESAWTLRLGRMGLTTKKTQCYMCNAVTYRDLCAIICLYAWYYFQLGRYARY
jgi:hypothetical protein